MSSSGQQTGAQCPLNLRNLAIAAVVGGAVLYLGNKFLWKKKDASGPYQYAKTSGPAKTTTTTTTPNKINAIVISGPSGVGKGTLIEKVKKEFSSAFAVSVSHTSRNPRAGEVDGQHYHFSTKEKMTEMEKNGEFLEICNVHGNFYGTTIAALDAVRKSGKVAIIEVDVQGSQKIKKALAASGSDLNIAYMFIAAPSMDELQKRITTRGGEDPEKIRTRLETAKSEMKFLEECPAHFNFVLVNDDLEKAYSSFVGFLKSKGAL